MLNVHYRCTVSPHFELWTNRLGTNIQNYCSSFIITCIYYPKTHILCPLASKLYTCQLMYQYLWLLKWY